MLLGFAGGDHFHLLPVVGKFLSTIKADDISSHRGSFSVSQLLRGHRKCAMLVATAEQYLDKS